MPFKMKGFPMMKGTGAMKAMKESAMKKMHASPKKAMKDPMKKMKDPMKAMKDPMKAMHASPKKKMTETKKDLAKAGEKGVKRVGSTKKGRSETPGPIVGDSRVSQAKSKTSKSIGPSESPEMIKKREEKISSLRAKTKEPGNVKDYFDPDSEYNKELKEYSKAKSFAKKLKDSPKKAMSPKKKMTDDKLKSKIKKREFATQKDFPPPGGGEKYAKMMKRMREAEKKAKENKKGKVYLGGVNPKYIKGSPKKAMSPKKKTIAKDKDPKFKKSNRRSQAEFEPMYEGADISRAQFNKMSKREQRKYIKTQTD